MSPANQTPSITMMDGKATTTTVDVASFFEREHHNVLQKIDNLRKDLPRDAHTLIFQGMQIEVRTSNGAKRKIRAFRMDRDGFVFLAMSFTGKKAAAFKWAYIQEFNRMDAELRSPQSCSCCGVRERILIPLVGMGATADHPIEEPGNWEHSGTRMLLDHMRGQGHELIGVEVEIRNLRHRAKHFREKYLDLNHRLEMARYNDTPAARI